MYKYLCVVLILCSLSGRGQGFAYTGAPGFITVNRGGYSCAQYLQIPRDTLSWPFAIPDTAQIAYVRGNFYIFNGSHWGKVSGGGGGGAVSSVNGFAGDVELITDNIPEGDSNFYWTQLRFVTAFQRMNGVTEVILADSTAAVRASFPTGLPPSGTAGGDLAGSYPHPVLLSVGAAGTYGDATHIPSITTDAKGRVIAASVYTITPGGVSSVNGHTGTVNLTTTDVPEGSNLYYTNSRVQEQILSSVPAIISDTAAIRANSAQNNLTDSSLLKVKYIDSNAIYATPYRVDSGVTNTRSWANGRFLTGYTETDPIATAKTTTITNGWGVLGGGAAQTIGSNPAWTLKADSSVISTTGYRKKGDDSVAAIAATKQPQLSGTGFVKATGTTISYDNTTYYAASNPSNYISSVNIAAGTGISVAGGGGSFTVTNTSPSSGGTVTSVTAGAGLSGGIITGAGTISMPNTGTAGTYGSSTQIPIITTDAQGRVSSVSTTTFAIGVNSVVGTAPISVSGTSTVTVSLNTTGTAATYGTSTQIPVFTTDAYGRVNAVTNTAIGTLNQNTSGTAANVTGVVAMVNGGTGATVATSVNTTPITYGTNNTVTVPVATGVTGLGTGIATWLATPTSANLATAVAATSTGSGSLVFATSPTFTTPALGTPASGNLANCTFPTLNQNTTGNAATVTTNANLTGPITSVGNATSIAAQTGTGTTFAMSVSPALTGSPTVPTQTAGDNSTKAASTAYVDGTYGIQYSTTANYTTSTTPTTNVTSRSATVQWFITAQAGALLFNAPTGTWADGQLLEIRIKDNGTARALTYNAIYRAGSSIALPTTTTISKNLYLLFSYNSADTKYDLIGYVDGF